VPGVPAVLAPVPPQRPRRRLLYLLLLPLLVGLGLAAVWAWQGHRSRQEWQAVQDALHGHDLPGAASALGRYRQHHPGDAAAWFLAARTARRLEQYPEAERTLERCQELGGVTDATRLEWDLLRLQQGDLGEVDVRLRMTIGPNHPDAPLVLEALVRGYFKGERLSDALQACGLWLEREPEHPWPWLWRGRILERVGRLDKALEAHRRALDLAPDDRDARLALGRVYLGQRQPSSAAEQYQYLLDRSPDDAEALLGLAECRIEQGRAGEAIPFIDRVLAATPSSPAGLFLRGKAAFDLDDRPGAERWLRQAVRSAPDDSNALHLLVQCLRAQGQEAEAGPLAERLEGLQKDLRRLDELVRMVARQPDDIRSRHEAGVLALRVGRPEEGVRWLQGALHVSGDHRPVHAALADYYLQHGDSARAEAHRRQAETP
jgi:tetratricopeptide (TPR) repeat protein